MRKYLLILTVLILVNWVHAGENLIPNGSFEKGMECWQAHFWGGKTPPDSVYQISDDAVDGRKALKITRTAPKSKSCVLISTSTVKLVSGKMHNLSLSYKARSTAEKRAVWLRISMYHPVKKQYRFYFCSLPASEEWRTVQGKSLNMSSNTEPCSTQNYKLVAPNGYTDLSLAFYFYGTGEFGLDKIQLIEEQLDEKNAIKLGDKLIYPISRRHAPELQEDYSKQKDQKFLFYMRNPREMYPDSIPGRDELVDSVQTFGVPLEKSAFYISVFALQDISGGVMKVSDMISDSGRVIPSESWRISRVDFWKRLHGTGSFFYHIRPERLLKPDPVELAPEQNALYHLQCTVPVIPKGIYRGNLEFAGKKLPVQFRVMNFRLDQPEVDWMMYTTVLHIHLNGFEKWHYTDRETTAFLRQLREAGITGIVNHGGIWSDRELKKVIRNMKNAGFRNSLLLVDFGAGAEMVVHRRKFGKGIQSSQKWPFPENEKLAEPFMEFLKDFNSKVYRWGKGVIRECYYQGIDEPHCEGKMNQARWEYPLAHKAGIKTTSTVYPYLAMKELAPYLDAALNTSFSNSPEDYKTFMELADKHKFKHWYIGGSSYPELVGSVSSNRYYAGLQFFKLKLPVHVSWTYQWKRGEGEMKDPRRRIEFFTTYPNNGEGHPEDMSISTLQFEGLREGILDYRYAATLENAIADAREIGKSDLADQAEKVMKNIMNGLPWRNQLKFSNDHASPRNMDNDLLDRYRWMLAREIEKLKERL